MIETSSELQFILLPWKPNHKQRNTSLIPITHREATMLKVALTIEDVPRQAGGFCKYCYLPNHQQRLSQLSQTARRPAV